MNVAGLNLDRITLGSLIIALGLLVDDAIIAVEMMVVKMEQGWSRMRAAAFAWDSTAFPMLTGTLVTAVGFLPVGIARSTAGEYAGNIFWIVGLALVVSWIVAVFFTPYIGVKLLPDFTKHGAAHAAHDIYNTRLYRALRRVVGWSVRFRWVVIALTLAAFGAAIAAFTQVQQQFFPTSSRPELFIEIRMPEGTSIGVTEAAAKKAEALIKGDADLEYYTTYIGEGSPRFFLALNPVLPNESFALIVMMTKDAEARERLKARLEGLVAQNVIPEARLQDRPAELRTARRLPGAVPRARPGRRQRARRGRQGADRHARQREHARRAVRLERAEEVDPARGRSGPRAVAGAHAAGHRADAGDAALRLHGDGIQGRHRACAGRGARRSGGAAWARRRSRISPFRRARARPFRSRRWRAFITSSRSPSCGGAIGMWC